MSNRDSWRRDPARALAALQLAAIFVGAYYFTSVGAKLGTHAAGIATDTRIS
jgi:hypothetical protein